LICNVKRKARPLVLNVKGEGYKIHHSVFAGSNRVEMQAGEPHKFDFGEFFINERKTKKVSLLNSGEFNFDFLWKRQVNKYITITPETGSVPKGEEIEFEITYLPIGEHQLKNYRLQLQIVSGPKYDFHLVGRARKPGIKLSSTTVDFGPCFVSRQPVPIKKTLLVSNIDTTAISVETDYEKKPHLDVLLTPGQVLMPEGSAPDVEKLAIPILFTPRDIRSYLEKFTLDFNNLYKVDVIVKGEGIPLQLELVDQDQAFLDFGILSVGGDVTKTVPLVNRSKKPVTFRLRPSDAAQFQKCNVAFAPDGEVTLKPREVLPVEVRFNPKARLPNFNLEIMLEVEPNEPRKLISLHGVSHGIELKLMDEVLAFGSVVEGSRLTKGLQLSNFGDVKAAFKWDNKTYKQNFTIQPESGYINPNSNLDLEVTFHPSKSGLDLHYKKIPCQIKGGDTLSLSLMGKSVDLDTTATEELVFTTKVRQATSQSVTVQNTEDREWAINPTISTVGDDAKGYFSGKSTLVVPARGSAQYEVSYTPQTMTKLRKVKKGEGDQEAEVEEVERHSGSLFFPLPNGTALRYHLLGTATEPDAEGELQETVTAKKAKSIIIPLKNWQRQSQRFHASWKLEGEADPATFIRGANTFDVGGQSTKEYKLNFLTLKAGQYRF
jgi:hydrocephalus-inducing protein